MLLRRRLLCWSLSSLGSLSLLVAPASAANITWIGGNAQWDDGGATANWNPADEPDANDAAIFNTNSAITLGTDNVINGLTMSASSELALNDHALTVDGVVTLSGSGTRLEVSGALAELTHAGATINNLATLFIDGGLVEANAPAAANATTIIAAGGTLSGNGLINLTDAIAAATTLIENNGTIAASNPSTVVLLPPAAATLTISAADADARVDLDGSTEAGTLNITRNQTLDVNVTLADIFNGSIAMGHETKLDVASSWILGTGAVINVDNGAVVGVPGIAAGKATIAGSSFSQNSGTINVLDADGTLQFDAPFTMNGGTLANSGHVIFNQTAVIAAAANLDMIGDADLTVEANRTVTINQTNFNFDGSGAGGTVITVKSQGALNLNVTDYDSDAATNGFDGTIFLDDGDISVTSGDAEFVMDGVLNMSSTVEGQIVVWNGEAFDLGNDAGSLDADLNVSGNQQSQFAAPVDFNADADVNVAAGATIAFLSLVNFDTVNGGNNAEFTGAGTMAFSAGVNVNEATTLNMVGGTVDLDGLDNVGDVVNVDAPLTINAATMSSFGRANGGGGVNTLDVNNSIATGVLTVNLDNVNDEWTLNSQGAMNLVNDNAEATLLTGSDVNVNGIVNVTGDVRTTARLDIGSTGVININTAAEPLRLAGGNNTNDMNTLAGGTVSGAGILAADTGKGLTGHGTINAAVDFDGTSDLVASGGTLTFTSFITDVNTIRTSGAAAVFNFTQQVTTNVTDDGILMEGGVIQGAQLTVAALSKPLRGTGMVTNQVVNNGLIEATIADLTLQTAGNNNDWDGSLNTGVLSAINGSTLELRDVGAPFVFGGAVTVGGFGRVYASGFGIDFSPGSSITLTQGTFQADESTDIGGTATINAGAGSTIKVQNNRFLSFEAGSATTLNANLQLQNNNIIVEAGAAFSGAGALVIPDGSHVVAENLANIGVLLDMQGGLRPGNSEGIGRINLFDYQQANSGELFVELRGTALNAFDRLVASGDVVVDGFLSLDIDEISPGVPFVPSLGQTFNIITGNTVTGAFDTVDVSGMPAGLAFHVAYLSNAVQLQVVNKPVFSADFDDDGDVDATDLAIWKGAFGLNQLSDANGDNKSDGSDFLIWQRQLGSAPAVAIATPASAPVPEPAAGWLALLAAPLAFNYCRRRSKA